MVRLIFFAVSGNIYEEKREVYIMQYIIDSADIAAIRRCVEYYPIAGVTTNPTIIVIKNVNIRISSNATVSIA